MAFPSKVSFFTDNKADIPLVKGENLGKGEKITPLFLKYVIGSLDFLNYIKNIQGVDGMESHICGV